MMKQKSIHGYLLEIDKLSKQNNETTQCSNPISCKEENQTMNSTLQTYKKMHPRTDGQYV